MNWDWDWAIGGITDEIPRTTGPECANYMTNHRRWTESVLLSLLFIYIMYSSWKRLAPIKLPPPQELQRPHSPMRLILLIAMSVIFGIEMGFKLSGRSMIFALNPCHVQTCLQIYLLASKPTKTTTVLFRIQMSNLNGPFLAFLFPEVEGRTYPFEQATYWIQHALLYIIPIYILRSGAYTIEDFSDFHYVKIGTAFMLFYHFIFLSPLSILTGINLDHMLCAAMSDPFQGQNYRLFACCHEALLCPLLNKGTVLLCGARHNSEGSNKGILNVVGCETMSKSKETPLSFGMTGPAEMQIYHQVTHQDYETPQETADSLRHRFNVPTTTVINDAGGDITAITAEYTMPTTKID